MTPLGTAGGLTLLERPAEPVLVINGDILTTLDYGAMYEFHRDAGRGGHDRLVSPRGEDRLRRARVRRRPARPDRLSREAGVLLPGEHGRLHPRPARLGLPDAGRGPADARPARVDAGGRALPSTATASPATGSTSAGTTTTPRPTRSSRPAGRRSWAAPTSRSSRSGATSERRLDDIWHSLTCSGALLGYLIGAIPFGYLIFYVGQGDRHPHGRARATSARPTSAGPRLPLLPARLRARPAQGVRCRRSACPLVLRQPGHRPAADLPRLRRPGDDPRAQLPGLSRLQGGQGRRHQPGGPPGARPDRLRRPRRPASSLVFFVDAVRLAVVDRRRPGVRRRPFRLRVTSPGAGRTLP